MKKIEINKKLYTVITKEELEENADLYKLSNTALICGDMVLPIRKANSNDVGICYKPDALFYEINKPNDNDINMYSTDRVIDFDKANSLEDIIKSNNMLKNIQKDLMISHDSGTMFHFSINDDDMPEMKALKEAINSKQANRSGYEERFIHFQNDMRLLKSASITLKKMVKICDAFDIECVLTLKDKKNAVNPMEREVQVSLNSTNLNKEESDENIEIEEEDY